jgi:hypothetical protein
MAFDPQKVQITRLPVKFKLFNLLVHTPHPLDQVDQSAVNLLGAVYSWKIQARRRRPILTRLLSYRPLAPYFKFDDRPIKSSSHCNRRGGKVMRKHY